MKNKREVLKDGENELQNVAGKKAKTLLGPVANIHLSFVGDAGLSCPKGQKVN